MYKKETQAVHAGTQFDEGTQGTNSPVYTSTAIGYLDSDVSFQKNLKLIQPAICLVGVDTTITAPTLTSHRHLSETEKEI